MSKLAHSNDDTMREIDLAPAIAAGLDVQCPRCRITVAIDRIALPNRCLFEGCPLNRAALHAAQDQDPV